MSCCGLLDSRQHLTADSVATKRLVDPQITDEQPGELGATEGTQNDGAT
jgi:hypothetical protein